jgi:hypothetical protein
VRDSSGNPLEAANLKLEAPDVLAPTACTSAARANVAASQRLAISDATGSYLFQGVAAGRYCLTVQRLGYMPRQIGIEYVQQDQAYTVTLYPRPIAIDSVRVTQRDLEPYVRANNPLAVDAGVRTMQLRQTIRNTPYGDILQVTGREVSEAVTLAEPDLFRALQRMPGVATRDDYTSVIWTRGAPWDQTRVYFDGLPLYNPTHAGWLFSSINSLGVGSAYFSPGVRSAAWGEGAAGILDLVSRVGGLDGGFRAQSELSVASARVAFDGELPAGRGGWMVAGRRTFVDWFTSALNVVRHDDGRIPYDFSDLIARVDVNLVRGWRLEASGIHEQDHLRGDLRNFLQRNRAVWGNHAARATLIAPVHGLEARLTEGGTRFGTELIEEPIAAAGTATDDPTLPSLDNALHFRARSLEFGTPREQQGPGRWVVGFQHVDEHVGYNGPFSLAAEAVPGLSTSDTRVAFHYTSPLAYDAYWAQGLFTAAPGLVADVGARLETGEPVRNGGRTRFAPRAALRKAIADSTSAVTMAWGRSFQYAQDIGAAAGPLGPQLHLTHIWLLAKTGVPVIRSDIATLGVDRFFGRDVFANVNLYYREASGVTVPDPVPGIILPDRPLLEVAHNAARGIELSVRRLAGRVTGSASYSLAASRMRTDSLRFPSPADVTHTVDLSASTRLGRAWQVTGVGSYASGVPYTQLIIAPTSVRLGAPSGRRTPSYASLDLSVDYAAHIGGADFSAYVQVRNVLGFKNRVTYAGTYEICPSGIRQAVTNACSVPSYLDDHFDAGLPRLPLIGLRLSF